MNNLARGAISAIAGFGLLFGGSVAVGVAAAQTKGEAQAAVSPPAALNIPPSVFASKEASDAWVKRNDWMTIFAAWKEGLLADQKTKSQEELIRAFIYHWWDGQHIPGLIKKQLARFPVKIEPRVISNVYTEVFTPVQGVSPRNARRVLINLHGGAFYSGARVVGQVESIPIASVGRIKVVSIDYRQAPKDRFPAASEDVAAVYQALLKEYAPENIGIYGCSAGGMLTAQSVAWFIDRKIPVPGAIGMICGTGELYARGDGAYYWAALNGSPFEDAELKQDDREYLRGVDPNDPLIFPMRYPELLKKFPPSLLVSGSRSFEMSSVANANNKLAIAGVESQLNIWDGVMHGFLYDPEMPESREAYDVIWRFFDKRLGTR